MNPLVSALLYPLSLLYGCLVRLDRALTKSGCLGRPVISVGNITWGGTGKTPVVLLLARALAQQGLRVAVLTRGYGRKGSSASVVVSDGKDILVPPEIAGDEPVLLARSVPGLIVMAGADRRQSARVASERFSPDVFLLDDGFQHWKVRRDLDIVCINAANPFGNGRQIPSGILREGLSALRRAGMVVLTNADAVDAGEADRIERKVARYSAVPCLRAGRRAAGLQALGGGMITALADCHEKEIVAFSAIGDNEGFRGTLERNGFRVRRFFAFRDHHWFTAAEIGEILRGAPGNMPVVTTTKDAVRIGSLLCRLPGDGAKRLFALATELYFMNNGDELWQNRVQNAVRSSLTVTGR